MLKSPTMIVDLCIPQYSSGNICCIHVEAALLGAYKFRMQYLSGELTFLPL